MPGGIRLLARDPADISTPPADTVTVFPDASNANEPSYKDETGAVTSLQGAGGPAGAGYGGTSTTSLAIGTGSKAFTTQAGMAYVVGSRVRAASAADPDEDYMEGVVTAYVTTTLTVLMDLVGPAASGTHADWNLSLAGEQGPEGDGVPPTVVSHGAMGATETFDYGDGPAHEGTVDAALTITLTGFVAGECIETLDFTTDGTGGYGVPTFPAAVVNDADYAPFWDDSANAHNLIVLRTIDSGTTIYIVGLPASSGEILDHSTTELDDTLVLAPDGVGGVEFRAESGGGVTHTTSEAVLGSDTPLSSTPYATDLLSLSLAAGTWFVTWKIAFTVSGGVRSIYAVLWDNAETTRYDEDEDTGGDVGYRYSGPHGWAFVTLASTTTVKLSAGGEAGNVTALRDGGNSTSHRLTKLSAMKIA